MRIVLVDLGDAYRKRYKMRAVGANGLNVVVSIPRTVLEQQAEKRGLTVEEFIEKFEAVALYNNFDGVHYQFQEMEEKKAPTKVKPNESAS